MGKYRDEDVDRALEILRAPPEPDPLWLKLLGVVAFAVVAAFIWYLVMSA